MGVFYKKFSSEVLTFLLKLPAMHDAHLLRPLLTPDSRQRCREGTCGNVTARCYNSASCCVRCSCPTPRELGRRERVRYEYASKSIAALLPFLPLNTAAEAFVLQWLRCASARIFMLCWGQFAHSSRVSRGRALLKL